MSMIYVIVITIALLALAKHGGSGRRKMGRYIRGSVDENLLLTTLAAKTAVSAVFDETVNERSLISSLVATWSLGDFTLGSDIGPVMVGVAHSDYTDAEIEAFIEATGSWDEGDKIQQEVSRRKVRRVGIFPSAPGPADLVLNDGKPIKTKLNWILNQGQTLRVWAYNMGASPIATTVPDVGVQGHANLWPR